RDPPAAPQRRVLAAPARPEERDDLALMDLEREIAHGRLGGVAVGLPQAVEPNGYRLLRGRRHPRRGGARSRCARGGRRHYLRRSAATSWGTPSRSPSARIGRATPLGRPARITLMMLGSSRMPPDPPNTRSRSDSAAVSRP